jgi:hypothetical protein
LLLYYGTVLVEICFCETVAATALQANDETLTKPANPRQKRPMVKRSARQTKHSAALGGCTVRLKIIKTFTSTSALVNRVFRQLLTTMGCLSARDVRARHLVN